MERIYCEVNCGASMTLQDKGMNRIRSTCVVLLFYVHGKHLRSCQDGQFT